MAVGDFTWDELRLVHAIAEAGSLAGAAERLGINGSTAFRRLGQLEERLGVKLFERHRTGYVPSAVGADMAALGRQIDLEVAGLSRRLAGTAPEPSGEIRFTTNDAILAYLLTPILAEFRRGHPAITLEIVLSNDALNLSRRDADVALRATDRPPETLVGRRFGAVGWAVYGARAAGWRGGEDGAALAAADWVMLGGKLAGREVARVAARHVPEPRVACRVDSVLSLVTLVEGGLGIGALPCFAGDTAPGLVRLTPPDPDLTTSLWLLTHPDLRHAPRIRAFVDFLAAAIGERRSVLAPAAGP